MSDFTPRANLRLPGGGSTGTILPDEQVDIDVLNDNFRKIDALLGARNIPSASSYSGSMDGDLVYARDTKLLSIYDANSAGLVNPRVLGGTRFKGTQAQMAAFTGAEDGDSWYDPTLDSVFIWNGSAWAQPVTSWVEVMTQSGSEPRAAYRLNHGLVEILGIGSKPGSTYQCFSLPSGFRPSRELRFSDVANASQMIVINAAGTVSHTNLNATVVGFMCSFRPAV